MLYPTKNNKACKTQERMTHTVAKRQTTETACEGDQMPDLTDQASK